MTELLVISLAESVRRRESAESQLSGTSLKWRFVDAVRGADAPAPEYDRTARLRLYGYGLTPGEVGCFLSHRLAWQVCAESSQPVLVLEDDFDFGDRSHLIERLVGELAKRPDLPLVRLSTTFDKDREVQGEVAGLQLVRHQRDPSGAVAYHLWPAAARRLLDASRAFYLPVDGFLFNEHLHGIPFPALLPSPVGTHDVVSTIAGRDEERLTLFQKARREFFRIPAWFARTRYRLSRKSRY